MASAASPKLCCIAHLNYEGCDTCFPVAQGLQELEFKIFVQFRACIDSNEYNQA